MIKLIPLLGGTILAVAMNHAPAFAGSYAVETPTLVSVSANPTVANASAPEPVMTGPGPILIPFADVHNYDPQPVNGYQYFKTATSDAWVTWTADYDGETWDDGIGFTHSYHFSAEVQTSRNDPRAGASAVAEYDPHEMNTVGGPYFGGMISDSKNSSDTNLDGPSTAVNAEGDGYQIRDCHGQYDGQRLQAIVFLSVRGSTYARATPGGYGHARSSATVTSTALDFSPQP